MADSTYSDLAQLLAERKDAALYLQEFEQRNGYWRDHKERIKRVYEMYRGNWLTVFPDNSSKAEHPLVPNLVQLYLDDVAGLAATASPSLRCKPANRKDAARAEQREQIAAYYRKCNHAENMALRYFQDLIATGCNFKLVLPDYESGFPMIRRIDPRHAYPDQDYSPDRGLSSIVVAYQLPYERLVQQNPGREAELRAAGYGLQRTSLVDLIEYYDSSEWVCVAALPGASGKKSGVVLKQAPNLLGKLNVVCAARPTPDGEFRGHLDQVLSVLNTENRFVELLIDAMRDWIYSPPIADGIENPEDWGSGAILRTSRDGGSMRRAAWASANPQIFQSLQMMRGTAREAAAYPEARSGQIEQNIASAAFVSSIVGNLSTSIATMQRIEAASWEETLALCFAVDEKYLDEEKYITGNVNARSFAEAYTPSEVIKGRHSIEVIYGGALGKDPYELDIRLIQAAGAGVLPRRTARQYSPFVEDVMEAEKLLDEEAIKQAGLSFIQAAASQGDFMPAAAYLAELKKPGGDPLLVLAQFAEQRAGAAAQSQGTEAFREASGMMRGGAPQASPTNVPGIGALPPLAEVLG